MIVCDDRVAQFVSDQLGFGLCPPWTCMGIERDGQIVGGVVFNIFEGSNIHITAVGSGWTRGFVRAVGRYVYQTLGCLRMTATTECPEVASYAIRLGGKVEGRMRDHFGKDRDAIIVGILKSEWALEKLE